jgi:hypothetical protein
MTDLDSIKYDALPPISEADRPIRDSGFFGLLFGGYDAERRPIALLIMALVVIFIGFVLGVLFFMGILSGLIDINPKALKSIFKMLLGQS